MLFPYFRLFCCVQLDWIGLDSVLSLCFCDYDLPPFQNDVLHTANIQLLKF